MRIGHRCGRRPTGPSTSSARKEGESKSVPNTLRAVTVAAVARVPPPLAWRTARTPGGPSSRARGLCTDQEPTRTELRLVLVLTVGELDISHQSSLRTVLDFTASSGTRSCHPSFVAWHAKDGMPSRYRSDAGARHEGDFAPDVQLKRCTTFRIII